MYRLELDHAMRAAVFIFELTRVQLGFESSRAASGSAFYCALTSKAVLWAPMSDPLAYKVLAFQAKTLKLLIELRELAGRIDKAMNARPSWM